MKTHDTEKLVIYLCEYMQRMDDEFENDIIQLDNNVAYRRADPVDHLEMIMAQARKSTADRIFTDLYNIIALSLI